ncbi:tetratricopeptide repeat protein [Acidobacteria bacterium AH-259-O06]|nr:tetratricopeptide repeat protein [Acidobacteria bacterium AH-259-O06]
MSQRVEDLVNIEFRNDVRIFAVMAALNAAGFDYETPGKEMSDVRRLVRRELQHADSTLLEQLKTFYKTHRTSADEADEQVAYTSLALLLSGLSDFKITPGEEEMPADVLQIRGFEQLVQEFYQKANIESLWQRYQPYYARELLAYRPVVKDVIRQTLEYFRIPPRIVLDRHIILIPDLLNAQNVVNARNLELVYYIVVGPTNSPADNHPQLQHEYLHFLLDPLVKKFGGILLKHQDLLDLVQSQPQLKREYQNKYLLIVAESLIESILLRLHPPEDLNRELVSLFRQGFVLVPYFERGLKVYEESELISFPSYVESLFQRIGASEIEQDAEAIAVLEKEMETEEEERLAAQQKALEELSRRKRINSFLKEAGVFLLKEQYESAAEKLEEILKEDPGNGNAFFYLAQIASQTKHYQKAFEYYIRAAGSPDIADWVRATSLLRIGNYLAFQGQLEKARTYFDSVLKMEGDLRGAREEAQKSIERLPEKAVQ